MRGENWLAESNTVRAQHTEPQSRPRGPGRAAPLPWPTPSQPVLNEFSFGKGISEQTAPEPLCRPLPPSLRETSLGSPESTTVPPGGIQEGQRHPQGLSGSVLQTVTMPAWGARGWPG